MPVTNKSLLIKITEKEFGKLLKLIGDLDAHVAMKRREDEISIKDVIAHRAHWIDLFLGWYADGLAGNDVCFPAKGYKWNELKHYNADLRESQSGLEWPAAVTLLEDGYQKLIEFIQNTSNVALYGAPMKGAKNAWTTGRWAEAAGASHFRSASKYIRSVLRASTSCTVSADQG
ncbi:hypothetical protein SAMN05444358_10250 [Ruegeria halocynthiae]|uniref:DinB superfamily protein n=1 Tax=Ruegeria halocynthiae TaxID=985054 RepID=A0A1H2XUL6_9RHOB|nr:ClbS/DfsB family four-helix bundle protein [Ruegeria halocynthiae]SDW96144.1 hypothetical protein SAMN05444358_10250 [Ruegeria halocynthiae]